jgi:trehalose 6-phosphate phosphatase
MDQREHQKDEVLHGTDMSHRNESATARSRVEKVMRDGTPISLFLDVDGTLVDIAPTPSMVHVPPDLSEILGTVAARLSGGFAIVTGRPIAEADELLRPFKFIAAGVHGAEMRTSSAGEITPLTPSFNAALLNDLRNVTKALPGVVTEDKGTGIALHYRLVPSLGESLLLMLEALLPKYPGQFTLCEGRKVIEILPVGFSKGLALRKLASLPDFANRVPVMIGDDIADIGAFHAAESLGGYGLKVAGENFSADEASFTGPADVITWLKKIHLI